MHIHTTDGTPILDVKPYLPPTDSVPVHEARVAAWFQELPFVDNVTVSICDEAASQVPKSGLRVVFYAYE